jgi:hypothetical protein
MLLGRSYQGGWVGQGMVTCKGEKRNAYRVLIVTSEGKRQHGGSRQTWEDNVKMDLKKKDGRVWIGFMWLRKVTSGWHWNRFFSEYFGFPCQYYSTNAPYLLIRQSLTLYILSN